MKSNYRLFLLVICFMLSPVNYSARYFLCGPDENGCYDEIYEYCSCIPINETQYDKPFCFNHKSLTCTPLTQTPDCPSVFIYPNQSTCLATIFHSVPDTPCMVKTFAFCKKHNSYICAPNGNPMTCHK